MPSVKRRVRSWPAGRGLLILAGLAAVLAGGGCAWFLMSQKAAPLRRHLRAVLEPFFHHFHVGELEQVESELRKLEKEGKAGTPEYAALKRWREELLAKTAPSKGPSAPP